MLPNGNAVCTVSPNIDGPDFEAKLTRRYKTLNDVAATLLQPALFKDTLCHPFIDLVPLLFTHHDKQISNPSLKPAT